MKLREEHRPGECHGDTKEEWEVRDAAYHHCPGIIRLIVIIIGQVSSIIRSTINNQLWYWQQNMGSLSKHTLFCHHLDLVQLLVQESQQEMIQHSMPKVATCALTSLSRIRHRAGSI